MRTNTQHLRTRIRERSDDGRRSVFHLWCIFACTCAHLIRENVIFREVGVWIKIIKCVGCVYIGLGVCTVSLFHDIQYRKVQSEVGFGFRLGSIHTDVVLLFFYPLTGRPPHKHTTDQKPNGSPVDIHRKKTEHTQMCRCLPQARRETARRHAVRLRLLCRLLAATAASDAVRRRAASVVRRSNAIRNRTIVGWGGNRRGRSGRRLGALLDQHIRIGGVHAEVQIRRVLLVVLGARSRRMRIGCAKDVRVAAARRLQHAAGVLGAGQANVEFGGAHVASVIGRIEHTPVGYLRDWSVRIKRRRHTPFIDKYVCDESSSSCSAYKETTNTTHVRVKIRRSQIQTHSHSIIFYTHDRFVKDCKTVYATLCSKASE